MFLGREYELSELNAMYQKDGFKLVVIYSRRRVGKTSIINEFCKDKEKIFYIAIEQNDKTALEGFSAKVFDLFTAAKKIIDMFQSWDKAFEYIAEQATNKKIHQ